MLGGFFQQPKCGNMSGMKTLYSQRGGASLLTTVILAIVLLGIVGGLTALSVNELRQASNVEQANRALSAAEGEVQKLASEIATTAGPHDRNACNASPSDPGTKGPELQVGGPNDNLYITCAVVKTGASNEIVGKLERDESFRINLTGAVRDDSGASTPVASMSIEWAKAGEDITSLPTNWKPLDVASWSNPAALELTYAWWAASGPITPLVSASDDAFGMPMRKYVIRPASSIGTPAIVSTACGQGYPDGFLCKSTDKVELKTVSGGDENFVNATNFMFKLTTRYNGTSFRLKFYDASGNLLRLPQPYATIDVTARSNNLYRRVVAQKALVQNSAFAVFENAVFSGKSICKDLKVNDAFTPVNNGTGKNSPSCEN